MKVKKLISKLDEQTLIAFVDDCDEFESKLRTVKSFKETPTDPEFYNELKVIRISIKPVRNQSYLQISIRG